VPATKAVASWLVDLRKTSPSPIARAQPSCPAPFERRAASAETFEALRTTGRGWPAANCIVISNWIADDSPDPCFGSFASAISAMRAVLRHA
jgi:hypothetical protein